MTIKKNDCNYVKGITIKETVLSHTVQDGGAVNVQY